MTPLETKATDEVLRATTEDEIAWTTHNNGWTVQWRGQSLRIDNTVATPTLYVGREVIGTPTPYDATPIVNKIEVREVRAYKNALRALAGGVE